MTMTKTSVVLLSLLAMVGCACRSPAGDKTRNLENEIQGQDLADSDAPADSYTRHLAIQGEIAYGDSVDGHYASGAYAAWLFTAAAERARRDRRVGDGRLGHGHRALRPCRRARRGPARARSR